MHDRPPREPRRVVERNDYYPGEMPYIREAVVIFTSKYQVRVPWHATRESHAALLEWCDLIVAMRVEYGMNDMR